MSKDSGDRYHQFRTNILNGIEDGVESIADPQWEEADVSSGRSQKRLVRFVYEYQPVTRMDTIRASNPQ
jgi:hypothetical protein